MKLDLTHSHTVGYLSDLKSYGRTEDGVPFIGEVYYVSVTNARGDRWTHCSHFDGVLVETDEEGCPHFLDTRDAAVAQCERLVSRIRQQGSINMDNWTEARPIYGSSAYSEYGQDDDIFWEKENN